MANLFFKDKAPNIYVTFTDDTPRVAVPGVFTAGTCAPLSWGPVGIPYAFNKGDTKALYSMYGNPNTGIPFFGSILPVINTCDRTYIVRVASGALFGGDFVTLTGHTAFTAGYADEGAVRAAFTSSISGAIIAKYPGARANTMGYKITSVDATKKTFKLDIYESASLVETHVVSRKKQKDGYGKTLYVEDVLKRESAKVLWLDNISVADTVMPGDTLSIIALTHGDDGSVVSDANIAAAYDVYKDKKTYRTDVLYSGGYNASTVHTAIATVADYTRDTRGIIGCPVSAKTKAAIKAARDAVSMNTKFCAFYAPGIRVSDQFNDTEIDVCVSGYMVAAYAKAWQLGPATAPAGTDFNLNIIETLANFSDEDYNELYADQINLVRFDIDTGYNPQGQKNLSKEESQMDRVGAIGAAISISRYMYAMLKRFHYKQNTEALRAKVSGLGNVYLRGLANTIPYPQIEDGYVQCDEFNNTPDVIENEVLAVDVFVIPVGYSEYIALNIIFKRQGEELTGSLGLK